MQAIALGAGDLSEAAGVRGTVITIGRVELRPVEGVEHLPAELHVIVFPEGEVLGELEIGAIPTRAVENVTSRIAERAGRVISEGIDIEVFVEPMRLPSGMNVEGLPRDAVGVVVTHTRAGSIVVSTVVNRGIVAAVDAEGPSRMQLPDERGLPATQNCASHSAKTRELGHLVNHGIVPDLRGIQVGNPVSSAGIEGIIKRSDVRDAALRLLVQELGISVIRAELQSVAKPLIHGELDCVVGINPD